MSVARTESLGTQVLFCGTADAFCSAGAAQSAYLLRGEEGTILLDCGANLLTSLKRHGVRPASIDAVAISHLHGDHFAGLPFLFLEFVYRSERNRPLPVFGPPGTAERVSQLFATYYRDVGTRPLPFPVDYVEVLPGQEVEWQGGTLRAFRVPHQEREVSLGYRVRIGSRQVVYSGDTGWTEDLVLHSAGSDLFICECSFFHTRVQHHLDYLRLAEHRHEFSARRMVLSHLGDEVLARREEIEFELAQDGLCIRLE